MGNDYDKGRHDEKTNQQRDGREKASDPGERHYNPPSDPDRKEQRSHKK